MKKFILLSVCFFCLNPLFAQLSGFAYLIGQSNHAGIKVKFTAMSGTAATDSTYTSASGYYSITLSGGIYSIKFSMPGHQSVYYNDNGPTLLTNTVSMQPANLTPGNEVVVSGNVSGTWSAGNIYVVNSDITVPAGSTLNILPGAVVKFNGNYSLTCLGDIVAVGASYPKILITSNHFNPTPNCWKGIYLYGNQSKIENCIIEYPGVACSLQNGSPRLVGNEIRKFYYRGIEYGTTNAVIKNNEIHDYTYYDYAKGIVGDYGNPTIECNSIYDGKNSAISVNGTAIVANNHLYNISNGPGINCGWGNLNRIYNNVVHHCWAGMVLGENVQNGPKPFVYNNTIYNCGFGIELQGIYASPVISNNIIINNGKGIFQLSYPECTPSSVDHNLVWNNTDGDFVGLQIFGIGQMVNQNTNGSSIDSYFNLCQDPQLISGAPFYAPGSPCINAGNTTYASNIGASQQGFCQGMVLGVSAVSQNEEATVFPNPFKNKIEVNKTAGRTLENARLYDISGRQIQMQIIEDSSGNTYELSSLNDIAPGIYTLELRYKDSSAGYRRVVAQ